ncbi:MAG: hypothetical protein AABX16_01265 [Nanoarchaeota archaeon]
MKRGNVKNKKGNSRFSFEDLYLLPKQKRSQQILGISFGVIFSLILIIFFIGIAFIVIKHFLNLQNCTELGIFVNNFEADVKKTWGSPIDSHVFKGTVPSSIEYVCFADLSRPIKGTYANVGDDLGLFEGKNAQLFFFPTAQACDMPYHPIEHLDMNVIIRRDNPYCVPVIEGVMKILIKKDSGEALVTIA